MPTSGFCGNCHDPSDLRNLYLTAETVVFFDHYAFVVKKMRHIVFVLTFMMLRVTLLQIKIIRELFTLSSRRAKDD